MSRELAGPSHVEPCVFLVLEVNAYEWGMKPRPWLWKMVGLLYPSRFLQFAVKCLGVSSQFCWRMRSALGLCQLRGGASMPAVCFSAVEYVRRPLSFFPTFLSSPVLTPGFCLHEGAFFRFKNTFSISFVALVAEAYRSHSSFLPRNSFASY